MPGERENFDESGPGSDGAADEFLLHFTRERSRIYSFIYTLLPHSDDAEDVFQQTSIALWKSFPRYDPSREFYSWACGVAYYTTMNFRRDTARRSLPTLFNDDLVKQLADERLADASRRSARMELLEECVSHLRKRDRDLLATVYREGIAVKEYAERMNLAVQTTYNRLSKIRKDLLDCINRKMSSRA